MRSRILIACEFSGVVRDAFASQGYDATSCDILETEKPGSHHRGDVRDLLTSAHEWDLIIAHPPCTRLCNSGVRWLHERELWDDLHDSAEFFKLLLNADCPRVCIENPIPHRYALERIGKKYSQIVQPWQFGHGESKATCLWLRGLPDLRPTKIIPKEDRVGRVHREPPSPDRWKKRSVTYSGIAEAMAEQWGKFLEK